MLGELIRAARANDSTTDIAIVSDHGFTDITHVVNLSIPFEQAGLLQVGRASDNSSSAMAISEWNTQLWSAGGVVAVVLRNPSDAVLQNRVHQLLLNIASDPQNGADRILDADVARQHGGFCGASFLVVMKSGYSAGSAVSGPFITIPEGHKGGHGFWPEYPEMHSSFFIMGDDIAKGRRLGIVDMRQIAPTIAQLLGVRLPTAKLATLQVKP